MKTDLLLLLLIILIAGTILCVLGIYRSAHPSQFVVVELDGSLYGRYPLDENCIIDISNADGSYNRLVIENGEAHIDIANCPDKICVKTGNASEIKVIACIPNRVLVYLETEATP